MSNRMLKDWTNSDKVNSLDAYAERFFTRLIMKADDFGCFWADPLRLKANLFPIAQGIRDTDLLRWLAECQKAGLVAVYESENKRYLQILNFGQRLRQKKSKFPLPTNDSNMRASADNGRLEVEEEIEVEEEHEVEEKGSPPNYWDKEENKKHTLSHCMGVALRDDGWIKRNKASPEELEAFNDILLKRGVETKTILDYKTHFANLKYNSPEKVKPKAKEFSIEELRAMAKKMDEDEKLKAV